jgi:Uma2 family endonuclease
MAQEIKDAETVAATNAASATPAKMTYEEFLAQADEDVPAEWVDGEIILISPASQRHQVVGDFLTALLRHFVEARQLGLVLSAPFQMKLETRSSGREPDVLFVAGSHLNRLKEMYLDGPADLAVEIISTDSRARDRGDKFYEYEQGGVREYWLIDPIRKQAEFYLLGDDNLYHAATAGDDGKFHSAVLKGLYLKVDWLWQEPLPPLLAVLKEWGIV